MKVKNLFEALAANQRNYKTTDRRTRSALAIHYDIWQELKKIGINNNVASKEAYDLVTTRGKDNTTNNKEFVNSIIEKGVNKINAENLYNK
jgi:hypothetical protein